MNSMTGVLWSGYSTYVVRPCTTCKPGPDGSLTGIGWALTLVGAGIVLIGVCVLVFAPRPDPGSHSAQSRPEPVMDAVQREDLERRAAQDAPSDPEKKPEMGLGAGLLVGGLAVGAFGLIILGLSNSQVDDDKNQLRTAAAGVLTGAIDGPGGCRQSAAVEARIWPSALGTPQYQQSAADCDGSPRQYASQNGQNPVGVFIPVEYVFSSSFSSDGQVTVYDKRDNRSLCVTVPDTDVVAAAQAAVQASATPSTDALPSTDGYDGASATASDDGPLPILPEVSIDPDPYIKDGACPDAPVSSSGSY